jgi:hypothetical protein
VSEEGYDAQMRVYPNPATDNIAIELDLNTQEKVTMNIIDSQGKLVRQYKQQFLEGLNTNRVDVSSLTPGIYIVSLTTANNIVTQRFIKN